MLRSSYYYFQCLIEALSSNVERKCQALCSFVTMQCFFSGGNVEFFKLMEEVHVTGSLYDALLMLMVFLVIQQSLLQIDIMVFIRMLFVIYGNLGIKSMNSQFQLNISSFQGHIIKGTCWQSTEINSNGALDIYFG